MRRRGRVATFREPAKLARCGVMQKCSPIGGEEGSRGGEGEGKGKKLKARSYPEMGSIAMQQFHRLVRKEGGELRS